MIFQRNQKTGEIEWQGDNWGKKLCMYLYITETKYGQICHISASKIYCSHRPPTLLFLVKNTLKNNLYIHVK